MSSLRRHRPFDSLELLLDTMCNTFGGIIMISLLMALLSRDAVSDAAGNERTASQNRELQTARREIESARKLQEQLANRPQPNSDIVALAAQRDALQQRIAEDRAIVQSNSANTIISSPIEAAATNNLAARKIALAAEIKQTNDQLDRARQSHQRQLRLPRERATGKKAFYFIVRYGRIYPIHFFQEGERVLNTETIQWSSANNGRIATALRETPAATAIPPFVRQLRDIPKQTYSIHFLVYDDSFTTFLAARQLPLSAGFDTGWEFLDADRAVNFSAGGEAPPAL